MAPSPTKCGHTPDASMIGPAVRMTDGTTRMWCAHRIPLAPVGKRRYPEHDAGLGAWMVCCPGAHAFWEWWSCGVYHLRTIPNTKAPFLRFPNASHEFMFAAVDPTDGPPSLSPDATHKFLTPLDLAHQVTGIDDTTAAHILDLAITHMMRVGMPPDSDFASTWQQVLDNTVKHFVAGRHSIH